MFSILQQFLIGLLTLSFLVFIHEGGHFLAARLFKIKVKNFSIGFGKTLWSYQSKQTLYCLKMIPFGGFVAMQGEYLSKETTSKEDSIYSFGNKPIWQRIIVALAGPLVNILFAFVILTLLYTSGTFEIKPIPVIIEKVIADSPADKANILPNDQIVTLGKTPITSYADFMTTLQLNGDQAIVLHILRQGVKKMILVKPKIDSASIVRLGILTSQEGIQILKVFKDSPAALADLKPYDIILKVNQKAIKTITEFIKNIQNTSLDHSITIELQRNKEIIQTKVTPNMTDNNKKIGVQIQPLWMKQIWVKRSFYESLVQSYHTNINHTKLIFISLQKILTGSIPLKNMSGPIGIVQIMGSQFQLSLQKFLFLLCFISLNLGLMNLLPLAITDGGIVLFLILEGIRKKPLPISLQGKINQITIILFLLLALFITFHDLHRVTTLLP